MHKKQLYGGKRGAALSTIATLIFLVVLVVTLIFLTVYLALMMLKGTAGGTAKVTAEIKSEYSDERSILYFTDDYGNKLTDLIGQALLYPGTSEMVLPGTSVIKSSPDAIDNSYYDCPPGNTDISTADTTYNVQRVELRKYLHCLVIPKKLAKMYAKTKYCLYAEYDRGGLDWKNVTFGNETLSYLPECGGGKTVSADIAPPPGYTKKITLRLEKA